jgi:hypothetical protein
MYDLPNLELLNDERGVIRVAQKDVVAAANAVIALLTDYDYRSRVGRDARDSAVDFMAAIDLASAWRNVFNQLGAERVGETSAPSKDTLRRGLESIFGFYRVGLERRDTHSVTPSPTALPSQRAHNTDIVPEQIARGTKRLEKGTSLKYSMTLSAPMKWVGKWGRRANSPTDLTTRYIKHARRAIRMLSGYAVVITAICIAPLISAR